MHPISQVEGTKEWTLGQRWRNILDMIHFGSQSSREQIPTILRMTTFSEQLRDYIERAGITDAELARSIGVRRQTIFRWKEGVVERPRNREDVLRCAEKLRLTPPERDGLLIAAGFAPENPSESPRSAAEDASTPDAGAPVSSADPTGQPAVVPWPLWVLVAAFFALIVVLAMGWWRPGQSGVVTVPTPVATPVATVVAAPGETLVLVAEFANYAPDQSYNVAGRVVEAIDEEIAAAGLAETRAYIWPEAVAEDARAAAILAQTGAAVLIWGEYDSGRVRVNWAAGEDRDRWEQLLPTPSELTAAINVDVPQQVRSIASLTLGRLYRKADQIENARAAFEHALAGTEDEALQPTLQFYLATVLERAPGADLDRAIELYTAVIAARPEWINARYNRGSAYLDRYYGPAGQTADLDAAIDDLSWVIMHRIDANAYINRGVAHYERRGAEDLAQAIADMSDAIAIEPNNSVYRFNRGLAYIRADHPRWYADLDEAIKLDPAYGPAYNGLCWGYALAGQPEDALPNCNRALELGQEGAALDGRAIAGALAGDLDSAAADLRGYLDWLRTLPDAYYVRYRGPVVEGWIEALEEGRNPFDAATRQGLR